MSLELLSWGSSPLTRGKPTRRSRARSPTRLIPAHAGKTARTVVSSGWHRAHPRSRGENAAGQARRQPGKGSSPLTRGKRELLGRRGVVPGLIPAHAGKTGSPLLARPSAWAHPRSRGENADARSLAMPQAGSSPLTRGKRRTDVLTCAPARLIPAHGRSGGLIPAHAGKTGSRRRRCSTRAAHPRSRGENEAAIQAGADTAGSSPLTRGKRLRQGADV